MQPKITITIEDVDLDLLDLLMATMDFPDKQVDFVLDNFKPDYKELIQDFLNKEVTFAELKQAIK